MENNVVSISLSHLPLELIRLIVSYTPWNDILRLSVTSRIHRQFYTQTVITHAKTRCLGSLDTIPLFFNESLLVQLELTLVDFSPPTTARLVSLRQLIHLRDLYCTNCAPSSTFWTELANHLPPGALLHCSATLANQPPEELWPRLKSLTLDRGYTHWSVTPRPVGVQASCLSNLVAYGGVFIDQIWQCTHLTALRIDSTHPRQPLELDWNVLTALTALHVLSLPHLSDHALLSCTQLTALTRLTDVTLNGPIVPPFIRVCTNLRRLVLYRIIDITCLEVLPNLEYLEFASCKMNDDAVASLGRMPHLTYLAFNHVSVNQPLLYLIINRILQSGRELVYRFDNLK